MKKFALCLVVLAVVAMVAVPSYAKKYPGPFCVTLSNFCDQIQYTNFKVGGVAKTEIAGQWDWECTFVGNGTFISGNGGSTLHFGTNPTLYPYNTGFSAGFNADWSLATAAGLFDLYGTFDGVTLSVFQTSQGATTTAAACSSLKPTQGKARAIGR